MAMLLLALDVFSHLPLCLVTSVAFPCLFLARDICHIFEKRCPVSNKYLHFSVLASKYLFCKRSALTPPTVPSWTIWLCKILLISVLGSYKINGSRGRSPSIFSPNKCSKLPSTPADVLQLITFSKKHEPGGPQTNKALKYRKQMGNSSDVRAGR